MDDLFVMLERLRALGATRVQLYDDGKLHSVDFGPAPDTEPAPPPQAEADTAFTTPRAFRELMKGTGL